MSWTEYVNRIVTQNAVTDEAMILHEIRQWEMSDKYRDMIAGTNYYLGKHDILNKIRTVIGEGGKLMRVDNLPNTKIIDNEYRKIVKQKVNYLLGKPFTVQSEDDVVQEFLDNTLDFNFFKTIKNVGKDSLNCGVGWLFYSIDDKGNYVYKRINPWEIIPGWRDIDHTDLEYIIRVYPVEWFDGETERKLKMVEYYTVDGVKYYDLTNGELIKTGESSYVTIDGVNYNWDRLPFFAFKSSQEEIPLINNCKAMQDAINEILSQFVDVLKEDTRNTILILKNYDGEDLGEFRRNLAAYSAIKVSSEDGVSGDVSTLQIDVNCDNYKFVVDELKKAMLSSCMGLDAKNDKSGTPNQMNIQSMYTDIDLDASDMELEYKSIFYEIIAFLCLNYNISGYNNSSTKIVFNTDMPMDETSKISNINASIGMVSQRTLLSNHPWVDDVEHEIELLKEQENIYD